MKVLYVIPGLGAGGGAERSLLALAPHLATAGIELTIAYFVVRPSDNAEAYSRAGVEVVHLPSPTHLGRMRAVRQLIKQLEPDVVHTTLFDADQIGRLAAWGLPARVITSLTSANYDVERRSDPTYRWGRVELVRWFDGLTVRHLTVGAHAVSNSARQSAARAYGLPVDRVAVVHRGRQLGDYADPDPAAVAAVRAELALGPDDRLVVAIGRHEYQKDHATLVRAFAEVHATHPTARLAIAGREGGSTASLRAAISELGLEASVDLLGHRDDVPALLAAADVVACTSVLEGFSGVLVEALAAGRPLVASAIAPNRELLGGSGVALVAPGDVVAFAQAIAAAIDDPAGAAADTGAALDGVRSWITVEHASEGMAALYRSLAAPGSRVQATLDAATGRPRRLLVVPDLANGGEAADGLLERVADLARDHAVAIATFSVGDHHRQMEVEDLGAIVHHLSGTTALGQMLSLRRLTRALRPVTVDAQGCPVLLRAVAR